MISPTRRGHARRPPASQLALAGARGQGSLCAGPGDEGGVAYRAFASTRAGREGIACEFLGTGFENL